MAKQSFEPGATIFEEGARADFVGYVLSGTAEVFKSNGAEEVLIGRIEAGEYVGEMSVLESTPHCATVRAATPLTLEQSTPDAFLARISENGAVARQLILRLSQRLRVLNQAYADASLPKADDALPHALPDAETRRRVRARLMAGSRETEKVFAAHGPIEMSFPFIVGRRLEESEHPTAETVSLQLDDTRPYRLSRAHFAVVREGGSVLVRDLGSYLGTVVNGQPIGREFSADAAALVPGENTVIAGGLHSPFAFRIVVDG